VQVHHAACARGTAYPLKIISGEEMQIAYIDVKA
jgi:hypothetical protein